MMISVEMVKPQLKFQVFLLKREQLWKSLKIAFCVFVYLNKCKSLFIENTSALHNPSLWHTLH